MHPAWPAGAKVQMELRNPPFGRQVLQSVQDKPFCEVWEPWMNGGAIGAGRSTRRRVRASNVAEHVSKDWTLLPDRPRKTDGTLASGFVRSWRGVID